MWLHPTVRESVMSLLYCPGNAGALDFNRPFIVFHRPATEDPVQRSAVLQYKATFVFILLINIAISIWLLVEHQPPHVARYGSSFTAPTWTIVLGVIAIVVHLCGCWFALQELPRLLTVYIALILFDFLAGILQVVTAGQAVYFLTELVLVMVALSLREKMMFSFYLSRPNR